MNLDAVLVGLEAQERAGAEEAVAPHALAADDGLEQERPSALLDLAEGADRRQGVADQLAVDRHQASVAGQFNELLEGGKILHGESHHPLVPTPGVGTRDT